jgi:hypothetical protein
MDQSLFAAPHGLSQRITSFIACACQGIHQLPLFHLIVLIANIHQNCLAASNTPRPTRWSRIHTARLTMTAARSCRTRRLRPNPSTTMNFGKTRNNWHIQFNMDQRIHVRPASRDMRDDARSGNINHDASSKSPKTQTTDDT